MRVQSVEFFYAREPVVTLDADGSQDALIVRITAGSFVGWGECEASPLTSIAAFVTPRSHGVCQPVSASVLGMPVDSAEDIREIQRLVRRNSMDLLQAAHVLSGVDMALWDLLGKARGVPVWSLLGYTENLPKTPYASVLFGASPEETRERGRAMRERGFRAVKFGWGGFGEGALDADVAQVQAARSGVGEDCELFVDAGQAWGSDVEAARRVLPALADNRVSWLEEPFEAGALAAYAKLGELSGAVGIAGGEAAHDVQMAYNLMRFGKVTFIQIDAGRVGGIGPGTEVAAYAAAHGVAYINHTFTSQLALSASLQPFAGLPGSTICEFPALGSSLAHDMTVDRIEVDTDGLVRAPDRPGLGVDIDLDAISDRLVDVEMVVNGETIYRSTSP
jgi:L-alanine-DL-glutamate epimerase-like enolase superfamily enzyme